jgi:hypothetical protein
MNTWPEHFMPVPPSRLTVDPSINEQSPKGYSRRDLQEIAASIPAVYDELARGKSDADMVLARSSSDPREHGLGETYVKLFRDGSSASPIRAHLEGNRLVVDSGNHRVRSAQDIDIPAIPTIVRAPDEETLTHVEQQLRAEDPEHFAIHDRLGESVRSSNRLATHEVGPENEKPRDWGRAERDR